MYRCAPLFLAAAAAIAAPAGAQVLQRNFPANALRGTLVVGAPPEATLNGKNARLAPGARIRTQDNLLAMSASISGASLLVHYTLDSYGLVREVWILTPAEADKRPWPETPEEAQSWLFDPVAQAWAKP